MESLAVLQQEFSASNLHEFLVILLIRRTLALVVQAGLEYQNVEYGYILPDCYCSGGCSQ